LFSNTLLVEGADDLYAIAELMGYYTHWPDVKKEAPVQIHDMKGVDNISRDRVSTFMKAPKLRNIGVVVDADDNLLGRWNSLSGIFSEWFPNIPNELPEYGLICQNDDGLRLGIWIMPNNISSGMLETFLATLVPEPDNNPLWQYVGSAANDARYNHSATYKETHSDKAKIHTWLAWQDPPGDAFGTAILKKVLNPSAKSADTFATWFLNLFQLSKLQTSPLLEPE